MNVILNRSAHLGAIVISLLVAAAGCAAGESTDDARGLSFDKRGKTGAVKQPLGDPYDCEYLIGMKACTADHRVNPEYRQALWQCGFDVCFYDLGTTWVEAVYCADQYALGADAICRAIENEHDLCHNGYADPATCPPGTGGSTGARGGGSGTIGGGGTSGGSSGGNSCAWCDCYGEHTQYHGDLCGSSSAALVDECWNSCW